MRACRARRRAAQSSKPGAGRQSPCRGVRRGAAKMNKVSTCPRAGRRHLLIVARRETAAARFATRTSHPVDAGPRRVGPAWLGVVSGGRAGPVDRRPTSEDAPDRVRPGDSSPGRAFFGLRRFGDLGGRRRAGARHPRRRPAAGAPVGPTFAGLLAADALPPDATAPISPNLLRVRGGCRGGGRGGGVRVGNRVGVGPVARLPRRRAAPTTD